MNIKPLIFILDASGIDGRNPTDDFRVLREEIGAYNPELLERPFLIVKSHADYFVICPDEVSAEGMRQLGNPLGDDVKIISGESGAVPIGLLMEICRNPQLKSLKEALKLDKHSRLFCISTEGDTDPDNYRRIVP